MVESTDERPDGFDYRTATPEQREHMEALTVSIKALRDTIHEHVPGSADRTLALRHLQLSRFFANLGILFPEGYVL